MKAAVGGVVWVPGLSGYLSVFGELACTPPPEGVPEFSAQRPMYPASVSSLSYISSEFIGEALKWGYGSYGSSCGISIFISNRAKNSLLAGYKIGDKT